ncbi:Cyanide hydratase [Bienertia sinuspersici]
MAMNSYMLINSGGREKVPYPCHKFHNLLHKRIDEILIHLTKSTFDNIYICWIWHEEKMDKTHVGTPKNSDMLHEAQDKFNDNPSKFEGYIK